MPNDLKRPKADPSPDQDKIRDIMIRDLLRRVNLARLRDALLGGKDNRSDERELAAYLMAVAPDLPTLFVYAEQCRIKAVRSLAANQRIKQWIHCAPGFPAPGSDTHEIVQGFDPAAHVLYIASDSTVALHSAALRATNAGVRVIEADIYCPSEIFRHRDVEGFLDWKQPLGLIYGDAWVFSPGTADQAADSTSRFAAGLAAGSYTVSSHFQQPSTGPAADQANSINELITGHRIEDDGWFRTRHQIQALFPNQELLEPGLLNQDGIDPDTDSATTTSLAAWAVSGIGLVY